MAGKDVNNLGTSEYRYRYDDGSFARGVIGLNTDGNPILDVNVQDQVTPIIILPMALETTRTTLAVEAVKGGNVLSLTDASGFVVGHHLRMVDPSADKFYYANIVSINVNDVTVDTPLDFAYTVGSQVIDATTNMAVDGSITPVVFKHRLGVPSTPSDTDITRIILSCEADSAVDLNKFGDLPALTNGVVLRKVGDEYQNIFNVKTNSDITNIAYDFTVYIASNPAQGIDGFASRLTFAGQSKIGVAIRIGQDDNLEVIIQDDLTGLVRLTMIVEGHRAWKREYK